MKMKKKRDIPFIWPSWISKFVSGEDQCAWKYWFKSHYMYDKKPSDFNLARWTVEHNKLLQERRNGLERLGYKVFIEDQNSFKLNLIVQIGDANVSKTLSEAEQREPMQMQNIIISGKADIVAIGKMEDDKITGLMHDSYLVEDIKSGKPKTSDHIQVITYMLWLPKAIIEGRIKYAGIKFNGCIVYKLGIKNVEIPAGLAYEDEALKRYIWDAIKLMTGDEADCRKVPSEKECSWCDITCADCDMRIG